MGAFNSSGMLNMRVFLGVFACVAAASATTLLQAQWSKFKADHGKVYTSSAEEALRMSIFAQNVAKIEAQNRWSVVEERHQPVYRSDQGGVRLDLRKWKDRLKSSTPAGQLREPPGKDC